MNNLSSIDWQAFHVTTNNETYLEAAAPLQKVQTLVTTMIIVIVLVSVIILSLVLTMWGRSRIHETGIFLSLGIAKSKIIGQYLTEVLIIAIFAFGFSYLTSNVVAKQLASGLLQQATSTGEEQKTGLDIDVSAVEAESNEEQLNVMVSVYNVLELYITGIAIIILSVGISSFTVMRLKPREILVLR